MFLHTYSQSKMQEWNAVKSQHTTKEGAHEFHLLIMWIGTHPFFPWVRVLIDP